MSETIGKLAEALSKAQKAFPTIKKERTAKIDSKKGEASSFSYKYADLASVFEAITPALSDNGLAITQITSLRSDRLTLITRLMHTSGEIVEGEYPLPEIDDPKAMGSLLTYHRRYGVYGIVGLAPEDDDDGTAASVGASQPAAPACPKCGKTASVIKGKEEFGGGWVCWKKRNGGCGEQFFDRTPDTPQDTPLGPTLTVEQQKGLHAYLEERKLSPETLKGLLKQKGLEKTERVLQSDLKWFLDTLKEVADQRDRDLGVDEVFGEEGK